MRKLVRKDNLRRTTVSKYELQYRLLKVLQLNCSSKKATLSFLTVNFLLNDLPKDSSLVRVRNRCAVSGRGNGVFKFFHLSRIYFRELVNSGIVFGVYKKSW